LYLSANVICINGPRVRSCLTRTFGRHFRSSWLNRCIVVRHQMDS